MKGTEGKKRRAALAADQAREAFLSRLDAWQTQTRNRHSWTGAWRTMPAILASFYSLALKLPLAIAIVIIVAIFIQGLMRETTVIEPISVPKKLIEDGYSPEVAARQLRDAMTKFVRGSPSRMIAPAIALHGELPNIVVPTVGLSLDAMTSYVRTFFRSTRSRSIAGEITVSNNQLWLRWRVDTGDFFTTPVGIALERPEELFEEAAAQIIEHVRPYLVAAVLYRSDKDAALIKADKIINNLPETDENVVWSYVLKSAYYIEEGEYDKAVHFGRVAIKLNPKLSVAYNNVGFSLYRQGKADEAVAEFRMAIALEPAYTKPHRNLADLFRDTGKWDLAIAEYKEVLRLAPGFEETRRELAKLEKFSVRPKAVVQAEPQQEDTNLASPPSPP